MQANLLNELYLKPKEMLTGSCTKSWMERMELLRLSEWHGSDTRIAPITARLNESKMRMIRSRRKT